MKLYVLTTVISILLIFTVSLNGCSRDAGIPTEKNDDTITDISCGKTLPLIETALEVEASGETPLVRIPKVNIMPELDEIINTDIEALYTKPISESLEKGMNRTTSDYSYYINGDIISLVVESKIISSIDIPCLYTVNVDHAQGVMLTLPYILEQYGFSYNEIYDSLWRLSDSDTLYRITQGSGFYLNSSNEVIIICESISYSKGSGDMFKYDSLISMVEYNVSTGEIARFSLK